MRKGNAEEDMDGKQRNQKHIVFSFRASHVYHALRQCPC